MPGADHWITRLNLLAHPEGGYFAEVYRAAEHIPAEALPPRFDGARSYSTSIYFLLRQGQISAFHRLQADEVWHHYAGAGMEIFFLHAEGGLHMQRLGADWESGAQFQVVVPAGTWFAARVLPGGDYSLAGCTLAPGFAYEDWELAQADALCAAFPAHAAFIRDMCVPNS